MDLNYSPILDESGKPAGVLAVVVETTQRVVAKQKQKQAEAALQAERDRLQTVLTPGAGDYRRLARPHMCLSWPIRCTGN